MKAWKVLALAGLPATAITAVALLVSRPDARSVTPVSEASFAMKPPSARTMRAASTGLFVGVRLFPHDDVMEVPYAADDAVELAYKFSLDQRSSLIPPRRVVLALSGRPVKEDAQQKLRELQEAGASVENATSGDILQLLNKQVARAGTNGLFVLSLATHGFLDENADAFVLGSTSSIGSAETSLRLTTLLDTAGKATRSLVFVDACRDRAGQTSRGASPDPETAAPLLTKMAQVHGQAVFYAAAAGEYAYDDPVQRNGVFTKAVLDGLDCEASAPRGEVIVSTLHTYVDRAVRRWIQQNKGRSVNPATQVSTEGETRNMPLCQCRRRRGPCSHAAVDGSSIAVYDKDTQLLWRKDDFDAEILHADVADLDADAFCEVVVGLPNAIRVFDRDGRELWNRTDDVATLQAFTTADLFRKHTNQIVTLWRSEGASTSRMTIFDSAGNELSQFDFTGQLRHVAVGRPTNMHAPKIAVTATDSVCIFDPKKVRNGPLWCRTLRSSSEQITDLRIDDADKDSRRDITVVTKAGKTRFDFDGTIQGQGTQWREVPQRKRARGGSRDAGQTREGSRSAPKQMR